MWRLLLINSKKSLRARVVKCTCGAGDAETLRVLRATTLADTSVSEFNEIVNAVNKAGGIVKTTGLWRMLISKAIKQHQDGVAKGDYVGHPFRGNQHADASGASRGGAGGPRTGKPSGVRSRDTSEVDAMNAKLQAAGDRKLLFDGLKVMGQTRLDRDVDPKNSDLKQPMGTLQRAENAGINTKEGRRLLEQARDEFEDKNHHDLVDAVQNVLNAKDPISTSPRDNPKGFQYAVDYVGEQVRMLIQDDEDDLKRDEEGSQNLARMAATDEARAAQDEEMIRQAPEGEYSSKELRAASRKVEAKADLAESMEETQKAFAEARKALSSARSKSEKESNPRKVGGVLSQGARQAIGILDVQLGKLKNESEAARANDRAGRGGGTGNQYGLAMSALQDRIRSLQERDEESRSLNVAAEDLMQDEVFAEIMADES